MYRKVFRTILWTFPNVKFKTKFKNQINCHIIVQNSTKRLSVVIYILKYSIIGHQTTTDGHLMPFWTIRWQLTWFFTFFFNFPLGKVHRIVLETFLYIYYCSNEFSSSFYFKIYTKTCRTMLVPPSRNMYGRVHMISLETYIWCF